MTREHPGQKASSAETETGSPETELDRIANLACWTAAIEIEPLAGGLTNSNYLVTQSRDRFVVRLVEDIPEHNILRWQEVASSRTAHAVGLSPEVFHDEPGVIVLRYIAGRTLEPEDVGEPRNLERAVALLRACHRDIPKIWRGPVLAFWPFQTIRSYAVWLTDRDARFASEWSSHLRWVDRLEEAVGPVTLGFTHNDLLAANLIDDGQRLWLIDWEYAGLSSELYDLAGLAANNGLDEEQENLLLETYYGRRPTPALKRRLLAFVAASALLEAAWGRVQKEITTLDEDYDAYTLANLDRLERALERFSGTAAEAT